MLISSRQKKWQISVHNLEQKDYIKYLGIYLDKNLTWGPQINHIRTKQSKNIGIIYKTRHYLNLQTMKHLYYTLIYPYLTYGILSWGNATKGRLSKVSTLQNKCIRSIFFVNRRESAKPYYNLLGFLSLNNIYELKVALFGYKITFTKSLPDPFIGYVTPASDIHSHNTRYALQHNFFKPATNTNYGISTFKFSLSTIWYSIPASIKNSPTYLSFKKKIKAHFLKKQMVM